MLLRQFSLKALFLILFAAAVAALELRRSISESTAKANFQSVGGAVCSFTEAEKNDAAYVFADDWRGTPADLATLKWIPGVKELVLELDRIDAECLLHLSRVRDAHSIVLSCNWIEEEALGLLQNCKQLRKLSVLNHRVTDTGLKQLAKVGSLEEVWIQHGDFTGTGLKSLRALKQIRRLTVYDSGIDDDSAQHLAYLRTLEFLNLTGSGITDQGVVVLAGMQTLDTLVMVDTDISEPIAKRIGLARPDLKLSWGPRERNRVEVW